MQEKYLPILVLCVAALALTAFTVMRLLNLRRSLKEAASTRLHNATRNLRAWQEMHPDEPVSHPEHQRLLQTCIDAHILWEYECSNYMPRHVINREHHEMERLVAIAHT